MWSVEKILKTYIQKFQKQVTIEQWYYQIAKYVEVKNQEGKGLLSNPGIKTPLTKVPILGDVLF